MLNVFYTLIIYPLSVIIECIYVFFKKFTDYQGICLIGVSIGITLLCLPLYAIAEKWQEIERDKQASMKKGLERIKKAFTGDERYMMTTTFYKQNHYSPLMALRSSFGLLIQVPFFIAAYHYLSHLEALRGQSFLFIRDLGAQDALFHIGSFPINVLPIAMTLINIVSGLIYTKGFPLKDKITPFAMALIFLVVLYPSPSGLVLYWTFNNIFSLVKNIFYKLKNPLLSFWKFVCVLLVIAAVYIYFFFRTKPMYKILFTATAIVIFCLPQIIAGINKLLDSALAPLIADKKRRHVLYILSCLMLFVLAGLAIPSSLIASSPIEFTGIGAHPNPVFYLNNTALQAAGFFLFWALCIYFLYNAKIQTVFTLVLSAAAYGSLLNAYVFMVRYGDISSALTFLNIVSFRTISLISVCNFVVLALLAVAVFCALRFKKGQILVYASSILLLSLVALTVNNRVSIRQNYIAYTSSDVSNDATSLEPIFHLSKNHQNVIMLMLDRAQGQYIADIMQEAPDLQDVYTGFTFYNNTIAFNGHTLMGAPGIYGGYEYTPVEMNKRNTVLQRDKNDEAILLLPRLFTEEKGFTATVTDPSWARYSHFCDLSLFDDYPAITGYKTLATYNTLWAKEHSGDAYPASTDAILKRNLLFFSFFRTAPIGVRELVYKQGTYFSADDEAQDAKTLIDNYAVLDYLLPLTTIADTDGGTYTCIINELTHESYYLQAPDFTPVRKVTNRGSSRFKDDGAYHTEMAALRLLGKWFTYLKENGIYDNTRIVIVSDHGCHNTEDDFEFNPELDQQITSRVYYGRGHYHSLLMVKDFNATGTLRYDDQFMTSADPVSFLLKDIFEKPVNPYTGKEIPLDTTPLKKDGVIISASDNHQPEYNGKYTFNIKDNEWWLVKDNIFKSENWTPVNPFADGKK